MELIDGVSRTFLVVLSQQLAECYIKLKEGHKLFIQIVADWLNCCNKVLN